MQREWGWVTNLWKKSTTRKSIKKKSNLSNGVSNGIPEENSGCRFSDRSELRASRLLALLRWLFQSSSGRWTTQEFHSLTARHPFELPSLPCHFHVISMSLPSLPLMFLPIFLPLRCELLALLLRRSYTCFTTATSRQSSDTCKLPTHWESLCSQVLRNHPLQGHRCRWRSCSLGQRSPPSAAR